MTELKTELITNKEELKQLLKELEQVVEKINSFKLKVELNFDKPEDKEHDTD